MPEVLLILAAVLLVVSILAPAYIDISNRRKSVAAYSDMKVLISAAKQMNQEYRVWPSFEAPAEGDVRYGSDRSNASVVNTLLAINAVGNEGHKSNPTRINFVEVASGQPISLRLNEKGEFIDPWGSPYQIVFDSNYDNVCTIDNSIYERVIGEGVVVWSCGPDRKSDTRDDLLSWKL